MITKELLDSIPVTSYQFDVASVRQLLNVACMEQAANDLLLKQRADLQAQLEKMDLALIQVSSQLEEERREKERWLTRMKTLERRLASIEAVVSGRGEERD